MTEIAWTLKEATKFVSGLREHFVLNDIPCQIGITGSVLYRGSSQSDLDIILYPTNTSTIHWGTVRESLKKFGMTLRSTALEVKTRWAKRGPSTLDAKEVEAWLTEDGRKVDVFFLS